MVCVAYLMLWLALDAVASIYQSHQEVSLWYSPTGLTFALLLVFGLRYAPVLLLTDVLHGLLIKTPTLGWISVGIRDLLTAECMSGWRRCCCIR